MGTIDPMVLRPVLHNTKPTKIGEHYWRHLKLSTNWILFLDLNKFMDFYVCFYTIRMLIDKQQIDITEFHFKTCTYTFSVKMYSMEHPDNNYNAIFLYFSAFYQIFCEHLLILILLMNTLVVLYEAPCKPPCEAGHLVSSYIGIFTFGTSSIHFFIYIPGNDYIYIYINV